jgi:hypothetical protein
MGDILRIVHQKMNGRDVLEYKVLMNGRRSYKDGFARRVVSDIRLHMEGFGGVGRLEAVELGTFGMEVGGLLQLVSELQCQGFKVVGPHGIEFPQVVCLDYVGSRADVITAIENDGESLRDAGIKGRLLYALSAETDPDDG